MDNDPLDGQIPKYEARLVEAELPSPPLLNRGHHSPSDPNLTNEVEQFESADRPTFINSPTSWRDPIPNLKITPPEAHNFKDFHKRSPSVSDADNSSDCRDRGEGAYLEQSRELNRPNDVPAHLASDFLAQVGSGVLASGHNLVSTVTSARCARHGDSLAKKLRGALLDPREDGKQYLPNDKLDQIITRENVRCELRLIWPIQPLQKCVEKDLEFYTDMIWNTHRYPDRFGHSSLTSRRRIFAILVLFSKTERIFSFIEDGLWDKDLPFVFNKAKSQYEYRPNNNNNKTQWQPVQCLNQWDEDHEKESFCTYQWWMLSPFFDMKNGKISSHSAFFSQIALPFINDDDHRRDCQHGGFGEISRVRIHQAHHNLWETVTGSNTETFFAIKRLIHTEDSKADFAREVRSLKRISRLGCKHLISLLATYEYNGYYHLMFPWADGNLRDFWEHDPLPEKTYERVLWLAEQCLGLTEGLKMIHHDEPSNNGGRVKTGGAERGRHGDIKPENILYFKTHPDKKGNKMGLLMISDFGLARWHREISNRPIYELGMAVTRTYRAPEHDLPAPVYQPFDVWGLGCLFLEFLTWYLRGWQVIDRASELRAHESRSPGGREDDFFHIDLISKTYKHKATLKQCVRQWINTLHQDEFCTRYVQEFLDLISNHMLRVRAEERYDCTQLYHELKRLHEECKQSWSLQSETPSPITTPTSIQDEATDAVKMGGLESIPTT
ncbi:kinase-like domain-containing protein [Xylariales sp. PMI_506]|nr:kinase-like domain-containing protein [Xylariales sp. PMI_506]